MSHTPVTARYLRSIEDGYSANNPYHSRTHAADVLQTLHVILTQGGLTPGYADPLTHLACYLAAVSGKPHLGHHSTVGLNKIGASARSTMHTVTIHWQAQLWTQG